MQRKKDLEIVMNLRQDGRRTLTQISKNTGVPTSTVYDKLRANKGGVIHRHCCLLDFGKLGFGCRISLVLKVNKEERAEVRKYLMKHQCVNNLSKINNGYDFMLDCIFRHVKEVEEFFDRFEERFTIVDKQVFYVIDELSREAFLTDSVHTELVMQA